MRELFSFLFALSAIVAFVVTERDDTNTQPTRISDGYGEYSHNGGHNQDKDRGMDYDGDYDEYDDNDGDENDYDEGSTWRKSEKSSDDYDNDDYDNEYYKDEEYAYNENDDDDYSDKKSRVSALTKGNTGSVVCTMGVQFVRHPSDCGKFYQCANGRSFLITCPAGLHFNTKLDICDWPSSVDCDKDYDSDSDSSDSYEDQDDFDDGDHSEMESEGPTYLSRPTYHRKKIIYTNKDKWSPNTRHNNKFMSTNRDSSSAGNSKGIFVTDTGQVYVKGSVNRPSNKNYKQTFIPVQQQHHQQQQYHHQQQQQQQKAPQFVTHYHYSYSPPHPQSQSQRVMSYPRKKQHKSWKGQSMPRSGHQSDLSALSKLIASLSSLSPSWYNKIGHSVMPPQYQYPTHQQYQSPSDYYQHTQTLPYQNHQPTAQKKIIVHHEAQRATPQQQQPVVYQKKIVIQHHEDRPLVQTPVKKIINQHAVIAQPYPHHHQYQHHQQPIVKHEVVVHGPVKKKYTGVKDITSSNGDHLYYYDTTNGNGDVVYYDNYPTGATVNPDYPVWEGFRTGKNNIFESFVDKSIYSKEKFQGGALFNPKYFGKAFKDLSSERNLVHHYHHQQPEDEVIKYIHHDPSPIIKKEVVVYPDKDQGGGYIKGGSQKGGGDDLLKTLILMSPGGLQTVLFSKLLNSLQKGGKSSKKGDGNGSDLLDFILLQRILGNTAPTTTTTTASRTPTIVLRNNQILRADTLQPVVLVDPTTGATIPAANAAVLPNGQVVNVANGRSIGYVDAATRAFVPAVVAARVVTATNTANRPLVVPNSAPADVPGTTSRQGINLIFLSPLTSSSLPPQLRNTPGSDTYIQGTLQQLLGNDLARFLSNKPLSRNQGTGITSAAGRGGKACTVVRSDEFVPFDLPLQGGRRLGSTECNAMGKLLDEIVPTFLQDFMADDLAASGLSRRSKNAKFVQPMNNGNGNNGGQLLPALTPSSDIISDNGNFIGSIFDTGTKSNSGSGQQGGNVRTKWNSISDYVTVRNDVSGCTIAVPHITTRC